MTFRMMAYARRAFCACLVLVTLAGFHGAVAEEEATLGHIHFLIPGSAGGGWDITARAVGETLRRAGLVRTVSFETMTGGNGGKALAHLIETADRQGETLMVASTPALLRSLRGAFPQSFRDLVPVASVIGDYNAVVVRADSPFKNWRDVLQAFADDPRSVKVGGGSVRGSMDHLVASLVFDASGADAGRLVYVNYDAGGKAMAGLLSGETDLLMTGVSEAIEQQAAGQVRFLAVTAPTRLAAIPDVPTFGELGHDAEFVNWRGFFAAPGLAPERKEAYARIFRSMFETEVWAETRARNGWIDLYHEGDAFTAFLERQEAAMSALYRKLGFRVAR